MLKKREQIVKGYIFFGFKHLFSFGLHLGHVYKKSIFYARWLLQGVCNFFFFIKNTVKKLLTQNLNIKILKNRLFYIKKHSKKEKYLKKLYYPLFIIRFAKTILGIRSLIFVIQRCGRAFFHGWYVCHKHVFMPFTIRFALLVGMGYSVFDWIAGSLTNFKTVFSFFFIVYREYIQGYRLEKKHYIFLFRLFGFNITGFWVPFFIFLPRMLESRVTNYEGGCNNVQSVALIDSNALSGDTVLPIAANDDSFLSINFFFYILTLHYLKYNLKYFINWRFNIRKSVRRQKFWILYYFIYFFCSDDYKFLLKKLSKHFSLIFEQPFFFYDENQMLNEIIPYGTFRFLIGYELQNNLNFIDKYIFEFNYK